MLREILYRYPAVPAVIVSTLILIISGYIFLPLIYAFIIAGAGAVVLAPFQRYLAKKLGSGISAILLCFISTVIIIAFIGSIVNALISHGEMISQMGITIYNKITGFEVSEHLETLNNLIPGHQENMNWMDQLVNETIPIFIDWLQSLAINLPALAIEFLIFFLALFLLLRQGSDIMGRFQNGLPDPTGKYVKNMVRITSDTIYAVFVVNVQIAVLTFFITLPFFYILGYGDPVFWSFISASSHFFPFCGPQMVTIFLGAYAIAIDDIPSLILIAIVGYPLITGLADFYVRPRLLGNRIAVHPALMMIGIFGGMLTLGAIGIIIGPLIVALAIAAYETILEALEGTDLYSDSDIQKDK